jgi:hypothetical protein
MILCAAIILIGWITALNARAVYDTEFGIFAPLRKQLAWAPSSVDGPISLAWMVQASVLIGAMMFVADLSIRPKWLLRIWITVGIAGGSIALFGLLQKAADAPMIFWGAKTWFYPYRPSFFATYYYHANAGAFLNLVFPLTVGLALRAFHTPEAPVPRSIWFTAVLLLVAAMFTNTSRVAQLLGLVTIIALAIGPARWVWRRAMSANRIAVMSTIAIILLGLWAIAQASGVTKGARRWQRAVEQIPNDDRWQAYGVALHALPDAGWLGFGPGTFRVVFPYYERRELITEPGRWSHLHQDYLQTVLEWGWAGAAGWTLIFLGGWGTGMWALRTSKQGKGSPRLHRMLPFVLIALGTVALHSLVDFPLQIASLQLYAATYLGICWASGRAAVSKN